MTGRPELFDQRTKAARRFKELVRDFGIDLGGAPTIAEQSLIRQAAILTLRAESLQAAILDGETTNDAALVRMANASARILGQLGVQHRKRKPAHVPAWRQGK